jgi:hypothetical protein
MKISLVCLLLALVPAGRGDARPPLACDLDALTREERVEHLELGRVLWEAVRQQRELPDGFAFRLPPDLLETAARWVKGERRCCPFFSFGLDLERDGGPLWLRITGPEGAKAFMRAEFGLQVRTGAP